MNHGAIGEAGDHALLVLDHGLVDEPFQSGEARVGRVEVDALRQQQLARRVVDRRYGARVVAHIGEVADLLKALIDIHVSRAQVRGLTFTGHKPAAHQPPKVVVAKGPDPLRASAAASVMPSSRGFDFGLGLEALHCEELPGSRKIARPQGAFDLPLADNRPEGFRDGHAEIICAAATEQVLRTS